MSKKIHNIVLFSLIALTSCTEDSLRYESKSYDAGKEWHYFGGTPSSSRYSSLQTINRNNVAQLKKVWEFNTGYNGPKPNSFTPLMVKGLLYTYTRAGQMVALDAATGQKKWAFSPEDAPIDQEVVPDRNIRGACYWNAQGENEAARVFYVNKNYLYAIDAVTGESIKSFGDTGRIDLNNNEGFNRKEIAFGSTAPCTIFESNIIIGTSGKAPGHVRAFDVLTGKLRWIFRTIPEKGELGYETWGELGSTLATGANNWGGMSIDLERGAVYLSTGSPKTPDDVANFYGAAQPGRNRFANSVIALDARTGKRLWDFQEIRHDIWDLDPPPAPNLVQVNLKGKLVDAVAQVTKIGNTLLLDRDTGEPLYPVKEKAAPPSSIPTEQAYPRQLVIETPEPFSKMEFTPDDITRLSPESHRYVTQKLKGKKMGWFEPPSLEGTVLFGIYGGAEWGGAAFDPATHWLYVNSNHMPWVVHMRKVERKKLPDHSSNYSAAMRVQIEKGEAIYAQHCAACHQTDRTGAGYAPSLLGLATRKDSDEINQLINAGGKFMPGFSSVLTLTQQNAVTAYVLNAEGSRTAPNNEYVSAYKVGALSSEDTGWSVLHDQDGYPASNPPWGTMNAINLDTGKIVWRKPLGEFKALTEKGIPATGQLNMGGAVVTAGGLIFIAATMDEKLRAFDKATGEILWETQLPYAGYASPATYEVNGRQYLVIVASGGLPGSYANANTKSGDILVAYALPDD